MIRKKKKEPRILTVAEGRAYRRGFARGYEAGREGRYAVYGSKCPRCGERI